MEIANECDKNYNNHCKIGHSYDYNGTIEDFYGNEKYFVEDYECYEVLFE
jgi:hypothetical protein